MKKFTTIFSTAFAIGASLLLTSCFTEDPGSLQEGEKQFFVEDFDRLNMGDAFHITVTQGEFFTISAEGDKRNLNDLDVRKDGSTLKIDFNDNRNRKHQTHIFITMPLLRGAKLSGASESNISGFSGEANLDLSLSGASTLQADIDADAMDVSISGASHLKFTGETSDLHADVSGASVLTAYDLAADKAHVNVSGASEAKVMVITELHASARGASNIRYKGSPAVYKETSGASSIHAD
jgi:hypothetical protein